MVKNKRTDFSVEIMKSVKIDEDYTMVSLKIKTKTLKRINEKSNENELNRLLLICI